MLKQSGEFDPFFGDYIPIDDTKHHDNAEDTPE